MTPRYGTWQHPCSKLHHQMDRIITSRSGLKRFCDAGGCSGQLMESEHCAVMLVQDALRCEYGGQAGSACTDQPARLLSLFEREIIASFSDKVIASLSSAVDDPGYPDLAVPVSQKAFATLRKRPRLAPHWFAAREASLLSTMADRNSAFHYHPDDLSEASRHQYQLARAHVPHEIRRAKSDWVI